MTAKQVSRACEDIKSQCVEEVRGIVTEFEEATWFPLLFSELSVIAVCSSLFESSN